MLTTLSNVDDELLLHGNWKLLLKSCPPPFDLTASLVHWPTLQPIHGMGDCSEKLIGQSVESWSDSTLLGPAIGSSVSPQATA